jgi:hypothetical protein
MLFAVRFGLTFDSLLFMIRSNMTDAQPTLELADLRPPDPSEDRPEPCAFDAADRTLEMMRRHQRMLARLAEIGMALAETVEHQALAQRDLQDVGDRAGVAEVVGATITLAIKGDFGLVYTRISRAVRLTMALEARIDGDRRAWEAGVEAKRPAPTPPAEPERLTLADRVAERREEVDGLVREALEELIPDYDELEQLMEQVDERLCDREDYGDIMDRPIGEVFASICKDLGVKPDWSLWEEEDWAVEEARTQAKGSPYAGRPSKPVPEPPGRSQFEPAIPVHETGPP